ncbi:MAG TPA: DUF4271 domain-containing protein [Ohtaekwangia sp.]|nr:DUF4271 domain-containing protein [Ohtaekwangia sp.]
MIQKGSLSLVIVYIFIATCLNVTAEPYYIIKKDLSATWRTFADGRYEPISGQRVSTVYFTLEPQQYHGNYLDIQADRIFDLFINGRLAGSAEAMLLPVDSLLQLYNAPFNIGVRARHGTLRDLNTVITAKISGERSDDVPEQRKSTSFRDFSVVAALVLVLLLIVVIRLNPKLASDYFAFTKIFSSYEGEDAQLYARITSSINIVFYVFCSLMMAYYLMIVFQFVGDRFPLALSFQSANFFDAMLLWLKLSTALFLFFLVKIMLVYGLAFLFGLQGIGGVHFFNWVRLLVVVFGAATVVLSIYFMARGQQAGVFSAALKFLSWGLAVWMALIVLKLRGRTDHTLFHLFSYICATELIPFLFIVKILYN